MGERPVALITGAAGGMGTAISLELGRLGFHVVAADVGEASLGRLSHELAGASVVHSTRVVDVGDEASVADLVRWVGDEHDALDVLVTAAGVLSASEVRELPLDEWQRVLRVNLTGTFLCFRGCLPLLERAPFARIIAIASDAAKTGEPWLSHYSASKFGVLGLVQSLALELARTAITVNAICPSIVDTPMMNELAKSMMVATGGGTVESWRKAFVSEIPANRAASVEDVSWLVSVLVNQRSAFMTGQGINLAGGHEMH